jgi:hypothetical protein
VFVEEREGEEEKREGGVWRNRRERERYEERRERGIDIRR